MAKINSVVNIYLRTYCFRSDAQLFTRFFGLKSVAVAKTASVHKLSTLLPLCVVVPGRIVAVTRSIDLFERTNFCKTNISLTCTRTAYNNFKIILTTSTKQNIHLYFTLPETS